MYINLLLCSHEGCFILTLVLTTPQVIMLVQCIVYAVLHCIPKECYTPPFTLIMAVMGAACCLFGIYYVDDSFWENEWAAEVLKSLKVNANPNTNPNPNANPNPNPNANTKTNTDTNTNPN